MLWRAVSGFALVWMATCSPVPFRLCDCDITTDECDVGCDCDFDCLPGCDCDTTSGCDPDCRCDWDCDGSAICAATDAKIAECSLPREAIFPTSAPCEETLNLETQCIYANCVVTAACGDLHAAICGDHSGVLIDCLVACEPKTDFVCTSGETFSWRDECDGWSDCEDHSDEHGGCPGRRFVCPDGERFPARAECDGWAHCLGGADEHLDCPVFVCGDGSTVPLAYQCDLFADCTDGSDEAGCHFVCDGGYRVIPVSGECDGWPACADGSDEHAGCDSSVYFHCGSGEHIFPFEACDGVADCNDGSDEGDHCFCYGY